jgi:hypothetical protein
MSSRRSASRRLDATISNDSLILLEPNSVLDHGISILYNCKRSRGRKEDTHVLTSPSVECPAPSLVSEKDKLKMLETVDGIKHRPVKDHWGYPNVLKIMANHHLMEV